MILKGKKVVLRPIKMADAQRFVKWFKDPEVYIFLDNRNLTLSEEKKFIRDRLKNIPKDQIHFCIDTKEGAHIGAIDLRHIFKEHKRAELGIMIGDKNYWSKGYGSDAVKALLGYAFGKLKLHRVFLAVYSFNPRAIRVYEKIGFVREGISREAGFYKGKYWDSYRMSILDREWKRINKK